ncbi:MAG: hypothetical protein PHV37_00435 [Candidatus Gastranaerophilales bacterium]|nr:hypothetical protein [Candidatus Gastranaerophilales bacterium]
MRVNLLPNLSRRNNYTLQKPVTATDSIVKREYNDYSAQKIKGSFGCGFALKSAKSVSFTSTPLYDVKLKKLVGLNGKRGIYAPQEASFSQLKIDNPEDFENMTKMHESVWGYLDLSGALINNFIQKRDFVDYYAIELKDENLPFQKKVMSLMQTASPQYTQFPDALNISFLQAAPQYLGTKPPAMKGAGELAIYGAVKVAKEQGKSAVALTSINDKFYDKIGFKKHHKNGVGEWCYILDEKDFDSYISRVENKYQF